MSGLVQSTKVAPRAALRFHGNSQLPLVALLSICLLLGPCGVMLTWVHAGLYSSIRGLPPAHSSQPHPAVARVIVRENGTVSHGSGTLVGVHENYGLVVTNWHVVRDAVGDVVVVFADGFRSAGKVLKVDPDWDLAVLGIWRPPADPMPMATLTPHPGDVLTIAGYGQGKYRRATGRCTQYVSPGADLPYEMVEVSVRARQGDSGGPIINQRGELAGVLFGSTRAATTGSYVGRVNQFLASISQHLCDTTTAQRGTAPNGVSVGPSPDVAQIASAAVEGPREPQPPPPTTAPRENPRPPRDPFVASTGGPPMAPRVAAVMPDQEETITWEQLAGESTWDQIKSILSLIGLFALINQLVRRAGSDQRSSQ